jgi:hypothetical protein
MKLIGRAGGVVASREPPEEYIPDQPPPLQDLINLVRTTYQFGVFPVIQPGFNTNNPLGFAAGRFVHNDQVFAVTQLMMLTHGDIVVTTSTDASELVMDDLMRLLDEQCGYRLWKANSKRSYLSSIVVEFDAAISAYIDKIARMEGVINDVLQLDGDKRWFKSLTFGKIVMAEESVVTDQISLIENADFTIERRVGQPLSSNRFFCVAPMRTSDHIRALEQIEAIAHG